MDVTCLAAGLLKQLISTVYPPRCVLCASPGMPDRDLCAACYHELCWIGSACTQCAIPLADSSGVHIHCGQCLQKPPSFDRSLSLFSYRGSAVRLIQQLKFNQKLAYSRLLGNLLADQIRTRGIELPDCLLPVPLYSKRLRQRGFNQSIELARPVVKSFGIPMELHSVIRVRDTRAQSGLDQQQRRKNMRGAFELVSPVKHRHVTIIDDVVTTTSTVNELSRVLKAGGVERVDVWSIARAV